MSSRVPVATFPWTFRVSNWPFFVLLGLLALTPGAVELLSAKVSARVLTVSDFLSTALALGGVLFVVGVVVVVDFLRDRKGAPHAIFEDGFEVRSPGGIEFITADRIRGMAAREVEGANDVKVTVVDVVVEGRAQPVVLHPVFHPGAAAHLHAMWSRSP